jgi:acyl-coenzyme A synthetase/AMP-(fatty) acid ligase
VLEFLGRSDSQVKLRGLRIELGEIEAALLAHPDVAQAAVIVREDKPGERRLVGYVTAAAERSPDPASLRRTLGRSLPDYMVPSAVLVLDRLPISAHGKLDRKRLPAPEFEPRARRTRRSCARFLPRHSASPVLASTTVSSSSVATASWRFAS